MSTPCGHIIGPLGHSKQLSSCNFGKEEGWNVLKFVLQHKTRQFKDTPAPICVEGIIINTNIHSPAPADTQKKWKYIELITKTDKIVTLSIYVVISGSVRNNWGTNGYKETDESRHKITHLKWQIRKSSFCTNCLDSRLPVVHLQQGRKEVFHLSLYQRKHLQSKRLRSLEAQLATAEKSSFQGDAQQVNSHCLLIYLEHPF